MTGFSNWYRLDNAAKLYPVIFSSKEPQVFRVSCTLTVEVCAKRLQTAVEDLRTRFPFYYVRLKKGFFWFYFETNKAPILICPDTDRLCEAIDLYAHDAYPFRLLVKDTCIVLEVFHALTDGHGAVEFLKAIVFRYLQCANIEVQADQHVRTLRDSFCEKEARDAYELVAHKGEKRRESIQKAYMMEKGASTEHKHWMMQVSIQTPLLVAAAKRYNATVTQYLTAVYTWAVMANMRPSFKKRDLCPVKVSVPVNLRKFYDVDTLRNFSLYFHTCCMMHVHPTFESVLHTVVSTFEKELTIEQLQKTINANVSAEKNIGVKLCPLWVKNRLIGTMYRRYGNRLTTGTVSNIGIAQLPKTMAAYVRHMQINLPVSPKNKRALALVSCNGQTVLSFTRNRMDDKFEEAFLRRLCEDNVVFVAQTEVFDNTPFHKKYPTSFDVKTVRYLVGIMGIGFLALLGSFFGLWRGWFWIAWNIVLGVPPSYTVFAVSIGMPVVFTLYSLAIGFYWLLKKTKQEISLLSFASIGAGVLPLGLFFFGLLRPLYPAITGAGLSLGMFVFVYVWMRTTLLDELIKRFHL